MSISVQEAYASSLLKELNPAQSNLNRKTKEVKMTILFRVAHLCVLAVMILLSTTSLTLRTQVKSQLGRIPAIDVSLQPPSYNGTTNFQVASLPDSLFSDKLQTATCVVTLLVGIFSLCFTIVVWPHRKEVSRSTIPDREAHLNIKTGIPSPTVQVLCSDTCYQPHLLRGNLHHCLHGPPSLSSLQPNKITQHLYKSEHSHNVLWRRIRPGNMDLRHVQIQPRSAQQLMPH